MYDSDLDRNSVFTEISFTRAANQVCERKTFPRFIGVFGAIDSTLSRTTRPQSERRKERKERVS